MYAFIGAEGAAGEAGTDRAECAEGADGAVYALTLHLHQLTRPYQCNHFYE